MSVSKKCAVFDCVNHEDEGTFIGDFCAPCHATVYHGQASSAGHTSLWKGLSLLQAAARTVGVALPGATVCPGPCCGPPRRPTIESVLFTEEEEKQLLSLHGDRVRPLLKLARAYRERATSEKPKPGETPMTREELIQANILLQKEVRMYLDDAGRYRKERDAAKMEIHRRLSDAERYRKERDVAVADVERVYAERDEARRSVEGWKETAGGHLTNARYYQKLLDEIAAVLGPAAHTDDGGGRHDEPIRAKLPELVRAIAAVVGIKAAQ